MISDKIKDLGNQIKNNLDTLEASLKELAESTVKYAESKEIYLELINDSSVNVNVYPVYEKGKFILKIVDIDNDSPERAFIGNAELMLAKGGKTLGCKLYRDPENLGTDTMDISEDTRLKVIDIMKKDYRYKYLVDNMTKEREAWEERCNMYTEEQLKLTKDVLEKIAKGEI